MGAALEFQEEGHIYTYEGERVHSVTQILDTIGGYDGIPLHILNKAAERGTAVHKVTELYDTGTLGEYSPDLQGYLDGWKAFLSVYEPEVEWAELRLHHKKKGYAGTSDRVIKYKRKRILLDIKATAQHVPTVGPQTAAYKELFELNIGEKIQERWVVYLRPNGTYDRRDCDNRSDLATFNNCLAIQKWKDANYDR